MLACTVRKLLTKVLIAHACLLLMGGCMPELKLTRDHVLEIRDNLLQNVPSLDGPRERIRYNTHASNPDKSSGLRGTVQTRCPGT